MTNIHESPPHFTEDFTVIGRIGAAYRFLHDLDFSVEIAVSRAGKATLVLGLKRQNEPPCYITFEDLGLVENVYLNDDHIFATVNNGGDDERAE